MTRRREPTWRTTIAAVISSATFLYLPLDVPLWRAILCSAAVFATVWAACYLAWHQGPEP